MLLTNRITIIKNIMKKWTIDPAHSEIAFKVKHLMISTVRGVFNTFIGSIEAADDTLDNGTINFSADVNSIETRHPDRNGHLLGPDFFDAQNFPKITFTSNSVKRDGNELNIKGDLTIKGVTKEVQLKAVINGSNTGMEGEKVTGFDITGKINRKDFGLVWNVVLETGGVLVGEEVEIEIFAEVKE